MNLGVYVVMVQKKPKTQIHRFSGPSVVWTGALWSCGQSHISWWKHCTTELSFLYKPDAAFLITGHSAWPWPHKHCPSELLRPFHRKHDICSVSTYKSSKPARPNLSLLITSIPFSVNSWDMPHRLQHTRQSNRARQALKRRSNTSPQCFLWKLICRFVVTIPGKPTHNPQSDDRATVSDLGELVVQIRPQVTVRGGIPQATQSIDYQTWVWTQRETSILDRIWGYGLDRATGIVELYRYLLQSGHVVEDV